MTPATSARAPTVNYSRFHEPGMRAGLPGKNTYMEIMLVMLIIKVTEA